MKYFITLLVIAFAMVSYLVSDADALCVRNQDWHDATCYGCIGCYPELEQEKKDWAPCYDYKGAKFMEQKKQEMVDAIKNDQLDQWLSSGPKHQHSNVYQYYELHGGIDEILLVSEIADHAIPVVAGAFTIGIAFFILKKQWIKQ